MLAKDRHKRRNWILIGEATTAPMSMMAVLLDASGAPNRRSRDGSGRWVHRRELRKAASLRRRLVDSLASGRSIDEAARQLGVTPEAAYRLADQSSAWS
ncbi:MAG TPA: hypothetical protein VHB18_01615 [Mycobacteriales bacterium]|nr:hypothetical protein [Mycobacteriales bacterium]